MLNVRAADRRTLGVEEGAEMMSSYSSIEGLIGDKLEGILPVTEDGIR